MAQTTSIQWCDSTVNPAMGCDCCELWPSNARLKMNMLQALIEQFPMENQIDLRKKVEAAMGTDVPTLLWKRRKSIIKTMLEGCNDK